MSNTLDSHSFYFDEGFAAVVTSGVQVTGTIPTVAGETRQPRFLRLSTDANCWVKLYQHDPDATGPLVAANNSGVFVKVSDPPMVVQSPGYDRVSTFGDGVSGNLHISFMGNG